jgi:hypothetical protein
MSSSTPKQQNNTVLVAFLVAPHPSIARTIGTVSDQLAQCPRNPFEAPRAPEAISYKRIAVSVEADWQVSPCILLTTLLDVPIRVSLWFGYTRLY